MLNYSVAEIRYTYKLLNYEVIFKTNNNLNGYVFRTWNVCSRGTS